mmetsp:Transcript_20624/g.39177  ORF Transcript_20624/g.39177 Transcript_20624/m.39177 type:complete len:83 (-) Transcript_20624:951-1199(-)
MSKTNDLTTKKKRKILRSTFQPIANCCRESCVQQNLNSHLTARRVPRGEKDSQMGVSTEEFPLVEDTIQPSSANPPHHLTFE